MKRYLVVLLTLSCVVACRKDFSFSRDLTEAKAKSYLSIHMDAEDFEEFKITNANTA